MRSASQFEIERFANERFQVERERISQEHRQKETEALAEARLRGNSGYQPALIQCKQERLRAQILAFADALAEAAAIHGVPLHAGAEHTLEEASLQMAGGILSAIRGEMDLRSKRTRTADRNSGGDLAIQRAMISAVREGKLRLKKQRIVAERSEIEGLGHISKRRGEPSDRSKAIKQPRVNSVVVTKLTPSDPAALSPGQEFPRYMYHTSEEPRIVYSAVEEAKLGSQWSRTYIHQAYPSVRYHWVKQPVPVNNAAEEKALGGGWAGTPAVFQPYKGPRPARTDEQDPCKWLDAWTLPGLSSQHRSKIKSQLLRADAAFDRSLDPDQGAIDAMKLAFDGVAGVLFEAGILSEGVLHKYIPELIWDSAIAGGWWRLASESREDIFPEQLGRYWVWRDDSRNWGSIFRAESAEWQARLLEDECRSPMAPKVEALKRPHRAGEFPDPKTVVRTDQPDEMVGIWAERAARRQAVVTPILGKKRWKPCKLAARSGLGKNSIYEYLNGKRASITQGNREAIADSLGITPDELPE